MIKEKNTAIILAAGQGKRMNSPVPKQFLQLRDHPVLFYAIDTFEKSDIIDEIILVTAKEQIDYCEKEIIEKYGFRKVVKVIEGGSERYLSVFCGIKQAEGANNIFIHDGARPFVTDTIIQNAYNAVERYGACAVGVPVKDTIKIVDDEQVIAHTPERKYVWAIQTPQVFRTNILVSAYEKLLSQKQSNVTDDAMVVEQMLGHQVKVVMGDYKNIKITTPEDLQIGMLYLK